MVYSTVPFKKRWQTIEHTIARQFQTALKVWKGLQRPCTMFIGRCSFNCDFSASNTRLRKIIANQVNDDGQGEMSTIHNPRFPVRSHVKFATRINVKEFAAD